MKYLSRAHNAETRDVGAYEDDLVHLAEWYTWRTLCGKTYPTTIDPPENGQRCAACVLAAVEAGP